MRELGEFLGRLEQDYLELTPHARKIRRLLAERGERVVNDHIALRTFAGEPAGLERIAAIFLPFGYKEAGQYEFTGKHLRAVHLEADAEDAPRIFISELLTNRFSGELQSIAADILAALPPNIVDQEDFLISGARWTAGKTTFERLASESEYAAWFYAHGFRPNHFTVSFNHLETFRDLAELNEFLKDNDIPLNSAGGEIKGSPADYLEQSSTLAEDVMVDFREGQSAVPGCYYEFARRWLMPNGKIFNGFIAKSADRIFESTDRKHLEAFTPAETDNMNSPDQEDR